MQFIPQWLYVAIVAPFSNALVNIVDVHFSKGTYKDELDGAAISCMFKLVAVPLLAIWCWINNQESLLEQILVIDPMLVGLAFLGGVFYSASSYFYFRAVMTGKEADIVFIESIFNLTAIIVPVLSVVFLGKALTVYHWLGIFLAFGGAMLLYLRGQDLSIAQIVNRKAVSMLLAATFLSISVVIESHVYETAAFVPIFCVFSVGCFVTGCFYAVVRMSPERESLFSLSKRFFFIFFLMETLELVGVFTQELALSMAEPYYISTVYCLQPVFALVIAWTLGLSVFFWKKISDAGSRYCQMVQEVCGDQQGYLLVKLASIAAIISAVILVSYPKQQIDVALGIIVNWVQ